MMPLGRGSFSVDRRPGGCPSDLLQSKDRLNLFSGEQSLDLLLVTQVGSNTSQAVRIGDSVVGRDTDVCGDQAHIGKPIEQEPDEFPSDESSGSGEQDGLDVRGQSDFDSHFDVDTGDSAAGTCATLRTWQMPLYAR
jgi:hypothetical protein